MSEAVGVLSRLDNLGVAARVEDGLLRLRPASIVPPELLADVRTHKAELVALLTVAQTPQTDPVRDRNPAMVSGLLAAASLRPPAWSPASALPSAGSRCSCCASTRWWSEAVYPTGWRCRTCHPPDHLPADAVTTRDTAPASPPANPQPPDTEIDL